MDIDSWPFPVRSTTLATPKSATRAPNLHPTRCCSTSHPVNNRRHAIVMQIREPLSSVHRDPVPRGPIQEPSFAAMQQITQTTVRHVLVNKKLTISCSARAPEFTMFLCRIFPRVLTSASKPSSAQDPSPHHGSRLPSWVHPKASSRPPPPHCSTQPCTLSQRIRLR
ncbi:Protein kinase domain-containing protein [Psidium guajava]|nr:Protein kinase domain-containing protein [Psidium guajava]